MQGATQFFLANIKNYIGVSIHAPYAGSDVSETKAGKYGNGVSIHAPYAGSDYK